MYKMIVIDLDGTILNEQRRVSKSTKEYLKMLKNNGYIITIATGRIYASALNATDGAEFANYVISDTGTCVYDNSNAKAIFKNTISENTVIKFFKYYDEQCRYIDFCDKNTIYKYSDEIENSTVVKTVKDKEYILNNCTDVSHISIAMKNNEAVINLYNKMKNEIPELDIIIMQDSFSDRKWIETMPKGCSKYNSIKALANYLNISNDEIISFGDGLNDIEMLQKCGYSVALANALPEVKKVANDITIYDHNNDGVIEYLKEHLDVY